MTKRTLRVIEGGSDDGAVQRVLCSACSFREVRLFETPKGSGYLAHADACMVNGQERAALHNPEGLCTKYESAADAFVADTRRLVLRLGIIGGTVLGAVLMSIVWLCFG